MAIKILIADDEKELVESYTSVLKKGGYEVYSALDGEEALRLLVEKKPDALILDIKMPKLSGEDILERLKVLGLKTKVIVGTAYADQDKLKERILRSYKISAFLEKPSTVDEILYVVKRVVEG